MIQFNKANSNQKSCYLSFVTLQKTFAYFFKKGLAFENGLCYDNRRCRFSNKYFIFALGDTPYDIPP